MIEQINKVQCQSCNGTNTQKNGFRFNKKLNAQVAYIYCKYWKKYFSEQYEKKYSEKFKNNVIECHNSRMSTRDITKIFNISSSTILYWIKKNFLELKIH